MKKLLIILFLSLLFKSTLTFSQDMRKGLEYKYDVKKVVNDTAITYYGWDFRFLIFNDPKYPQGSDVTFKLLPKLHEIIDEDFGADFMEKKFKKEHFVYDSRSIQSLIKNVDEKNFVDIYREPLTIDSVRAIVKAYPVTGKGLGAVIIADEMRKRDITVTAYVTIFSMETKEVLYACKIKGKAGDKGSVGRFYGKGVREISSIFWRYYYELFKEQGK